MELSKNYVLVNKFIDDNTKLLRKIQIVQLIYQLQYTVPVCIYRQC